MLQTSPYTPLKCPMALATFWYLGRETPQRTRAVEPKGPSLLRDVAQKCGGGRHKKAIQNQLFTRTAQIREVRRFARDYWRFQRGKTGRRLLVSEVLAEGKELGSNGLLSWSAQKPTCKGAEI